MATMVKNPVSLHDEQKDQNMFQLLIKKASWSLRSSCGSDQFYMGWQQVLAAWQDLKVYTYIWLHFYKNESLMSYSSVTIAVQLQF